MTGARVSAAAMARAARAFVETLDAAATVRAALPFEVQERYNWHYVPRPRLGLPIKDMNGAQRDALAVLLGSGLSRDALRRVAVIRGLDDVLKEIEQGRGPLRDPLNYYVTVFGTPGPRGAWGWRFEGHHVSLQWTIIDGAIAADTPQFLGANPADVRHGPQQGTRVLAAEDDLGYRLLGALPAEARREAIVSEQAPGDILTAASGRAVPQAATGATYASLDARSRDLLVTLIRRYADVQGAPISRARVARVRAGGLENLRFAWMGATEPGGPHYYRVQGPTFLIEMDNTQDQANHIHSVWRDFERDFGRDLLTEHYRASHHAARLLGDKAT